MTASFTRGPRTDRLRAVRAAMRTPVRVAISAVIVFLGVNAPGVISSGSALSLLRVPLEAILALVILAVLPWTPVRRIVASLAALVFVTTILSAALDRGFVSAVGQPFNVVTGWPDLVSAYGVLSDSTGAAVAPVIVGLLILVVAGVGLLLTRALLQLSTVLRHRARVTGIGATALTAGWIVLAIAGAQVVSGQPVAAADTVRMTMTKADQVSATVAEQAVFERAAATGDFEKVPASDLLGGLRGKDVIIAFVESYGQVAVQDTTFSKGVDDVLRKGTADLAAHGYSERSAFMTSSTFGGISWLAHSTLQTGLWIDSQVKYNRVTAGKRLTLTSAFKKAGWHTVSDVPSNYLAWPIGKSFYHYDTQINSQNVGYNGPAFSYARVPDQFTWAYLQKTELSQPHKPLMAEIDFVSSHTPWTPLPKEVPWEAIEDGSIYDSQPAQGLDPSVVWQSAQHVQQLYGQSVEYSMSSLFSFLTTFNDPNLVMVVLGDHQPGTVVSGADANHVVPISVISKDPAVIDRIAPWRWESGMLPSPNAPLWRMDEFRNRFLAAFQR